MEERPQVEKDGRARRTPGVLGWLLVGAVALVALSVLFWFLVLPALTPRLSEQEVEEAIMAHIQRESAEAFLVTGRLDVMGTASVENTRTLLPSLLDLSLGTTRSTVRAPGRVSYGFDVRQLRPDMIHVRGDSIIEIELPALSIYSVEPDLSRMEVETDVGWARTRAGSGERTEHRAIAIIEQALRTQGREHLRTSTQPRIHTAEALRDMLAPVLTALELDDVALRFNLTDEIRMEGRSLEGSVR